MNTLFCDTLGLADLHSHSEWPASRHRIASAFASWERIAEDFHSENAHRRIFASHCIAMSARIARYGPLSSHEIPRFRRVFFFGGGGDRRVKQVRFGKLAFLQLMERFFEPKNA